MTMVYRFKHKITGRIVETVNAILIAEYRSNPDFEEIAPVMEVDRE